MVAKTLDAGTVLGGYQIESILGRGGMGVVYKAHELSLNRKVALKVLSEKLSSDQEFIQRFKREAQIIAALEHPHIVRILSYGEEEDLYYYAMEYIPGKDLAQILKERSVMPLDEALRITAQIADALAEADKRGVVHRDLKPSNIMIDDKGRVRITDFGIAYFKETDVKLTRTGWFLGTPEFASPEQASGASLDVRSDIYSLGAVLYWMLAGKPPFTGDSPQAVLIKIATESLPPIEKVNPDVPEPVRRLIEKMTAKDPAARFQKPDEILAAIDGCTGKSAPPVPPAKTARAMIAGRKGESSKARDAGVLLVIALVLLLLVWQGSRLYHQLVEPSGQAGQTAAPVKRKIKASAQVTQADPAFSAPTPADSLQIPAPDVRVVTPPSETPEFAQEEIPAGQITEPVTESGPAPDSIASADPLLPPDSPEIVPPPRAGGDRLIRKIPNVLVIASGDEALAPLLRANLAAIILRSGLKVIRITEIPSLREKIQMGRVPISRYRIREMVPRNKADIILLAQIQRAGTTNLEFYGQTQEMTTATFTVEALDLATGNALESQAMGTATFSALNMVENIKEAVQESAGEIGQEIRSYWQDKYGGSGREG